jgi:hypothetical protein
VAGLTLGEGLGYAASALVAASFLMSSVVRLRLVNAGGAALFALYGWAIGAPPIVVTNGLILAIQAGQIVRLLTRRESFDLLDLGTSRTAFLQRFLAFHREGLARVAPGFDLAAHPEAEAVFVLRDMLPVGLLVWLRQAPDTVCVLLDYAIPAYRDLRTGRYAFGVLVPRWRGEGVTRILARGGDRTHERYLSRVGFAAASPVAPCGPQCSGSCREHTSAGQSHLISERRR